MSKNRKRNCLDPTRINNYNKFLNILDKSNNNKKSVNNDMPNDRTTHNKIKTELHKNNQIDKIIENIALNFALNNMETFKNASNKNVNVKIYRIFSNNSESAENVTTKKETQPVPVPIRETISINSEINNISDILNLINTYKNDPAIKYNIDMNALHNIKEPLEELNNMIGMKDLKNNIVDQILYFVQQFHKNKNSSGEFLHTVIYGPPGTGKTEIAKIMGKIYSKIGILSKGTFKKVTRSDLIAGYLGQTALKTKEVIQEALGGVLFIDEAYALGNSEKRDSFSKECIDTLCESLSDNKDNLMVIIAGYQKELEESFFSFNQGLDSRFTWRFKTDEYSSEDLYHIFIKMVNDIGWEFVVNSKITIDWFKKNKEYFQFFGRDMELLLAKTKIAHSKRVFCLSDNDKKKITLKDLDNGLDIFLRNSDVKNKKNEIEMKRYLYNTIYS